MDANAADFFIEDRWWMCDSLPDLMAYSKLTRHQILLVIKTLRETHQIIETGQHDHKFAVRRNWFSVNRDTLLAVLSSPIVRKPDDVSVQNRTIDSPETGRYLLITKSPTESLSESLKKDIPIETPIDTKPDDRMETAMVIELKPKKKERPPMDQESIDLGKKWHAYARSNTKTKPYSSWSDESFAQELINLKFKTGLTAAYLTQVLEFLEKDDFWRPNGLSPKNLSTISKNGKRKIDNIIDAMERAKKQTWSRYGSPKVDFSADNGKFKNDNDDRPW